MAVIERIHRSLASPLLDRLDSEKMHVVAREALHLAETTPFTLALLERIAAFEGKRFSNKKLNIVVGGVQFENPVMLGAGWDKEGRSVAAWHRLGMAGVEVGTVLAYGQSGNEKPRQFVVGPGVALNRLGFNAPPADVVKRNLQKYQRQGIVIGVSVGKNKEIEKDAAKMHGIVVRDLYDEASYFAINVSSPNTPGLRQLQDKGPLTEIVQAVNSVMDQKGGRKPVFVKIAPDLSNEAVDDVIEVVMDNGLAGIIATNTTIDAGIKRRYGVENEMGGISGNDADFRRMSTEKIAHIYRETNGKLAVIGIGGVRNFETALEKIQMGARVIQIVTGIRDPQHFGPHLPGKINRGLVSFMERNGIKSIDELVGSAHTVRWEPLPAGELLAELQAPLVSKLYQAEMDPELKKVIEQVLIISSTTTPKVADLYRKIAWFMVSRGEPWPEIWGPYNLQEIIPLMQDIVAKYASEESIEDRGLTELPRNSHTLSDSEEADSS